MPSSTSAQQDAENDRSNAWRPSNQQTANRIVKTCGCCHAWTEHTQSPTQLLGADSETESFLFYWAKNGIVRNVFHPLGARLPKAWHSPFNIRSGFGARCTNAVSRMCYFVLITTLFVLYTTVLTWYYVNSKTIKANLRRFKHPACR